MCNDNNKGGGRPATERERTPYGHLHPERRPIQRGGGLWGGEGDERRFAALLRRLIPQRVRA